MHKYETIEVRIDSRVAVVTLNRPDVRNALNNTIVSELYDVFEKLAGADEIRCIVLTGKGSSFCSGADLKWLKNIQSNSSQRNYDESLKLTKLLFLINNHPKPVIAKVNGPAVGGGVGLMLGCDIVIAEENLRFGLSEVAMGIVPAAIVPFIVNRIGETLAREYLITGERVHAAEAVRIGLINYAVPLEQLDEFVDSKVDRILKNGPQAIQIVKEMIFKTQLYKSDELHNYIADVITELRKSDEAREGMDAFIEKRKPGWVG